jgi:hypothetical protein
MLFVSRIRAAGESTPRLFACQRHVFIGRRVSMASNQAEPQLADPWISAVDEGQLPDN